MRDITTERRDQIWRSETLSDLYLDHVRVAVPLADEQIDVMLRLLGASGRPLRTFVDLGCGDGILSAAILNRFRSAQAMLLDFSAKMLDKARKNLARFGYEHQFKLIDYGNLGWFTRLNGSASFDAVVSGYSIHHQPDPRKRELYREIFDLLSPGGLFINLEHVSSPTPWSQSISDDRFIDALFDFHHERESATSRNEIAGRFFDRPDKVANILAPVDIQCDWLRQIWYCDVDCYFKLFELAVFGGRRPNN